nr:MAG TPA: hypothetical protein [Caudoviricetes sp.]
MQSGFNFINNHSFHHLIGKLYQRTATRTIREVSRCMIY